MRRVLIIDESLTVRMDLDEGFREGGWATTLCPSASCAREVLKNESFDCAILDVLLSDANGIDLLREMKSHAATAGIPVILLATEAEIADRAKGRIAGADDYVGKPYDRARVVAQARRLADRRDETARSEVSVPAILAVDDSPTYLDALAVELGRDNYDVVKAQSGQQALEQLQTHKVDCILLDMLMPGMSGQEMCRRLKDSPEWRSIPVIMLTGREDRDAIIDSFSSGADDYVPKSGDFTVLRARLQAQLRRKASEEDASRTREEMHKRDVEVAEAAAVRRQNAVLQGVNQVLEQSLKAPNLESLGEACLAVGEALTESRVGFIGEIGPDGYLHDVAISNPGWDACQMYDQAGHRAPPGSFAIHGIYGRVLADGKSLIVNDPASHPDRIDVPSGHPPLSAFLGVPLLEEGRVIGMIAVGNRPGGYRPEDLESLEILAPSVVEAMARKRAEETLRRTAADLARSNKDLEQFAYIASHDLQEPLRQVRSFVQILRDQHADRFDGKAAEYFGFVYDGTSRMSELVRSLLEYSRVGARERKHEPVECQALLDAAISNLQASITESHAQITHDDLPTVMAEPTQFVQLLQNLIGNAIKFRRDDVRPEVHVGCRREGNRWLLWVRDNGIGIAPEHHDKVFLVFQRLHGRGKYPGTGIGLAICKKIVEQHGGRIWIESKLDEGATFYFTVPEAGPR